MGGGRCTGGGCSLGLELDGRLRDAATTSTRTGSRFDGFLALVRCSKALGRLGLTLAAARVARSSFLHHVFSNRSGDRNATWPQTKYMSSSVSVSVETRRSD